MADAQLLAYVYTTFHLQPDLQCCIDYFCQSKGL